jgi:hypothetical protein
MYLKEKLCEVNKESSLLIALNTYRPRLLQKRGQSMQA